MTDNRARVFAIISAVLGVAALRLAPHPPNFAPITAMALFSGASLGKRPISFAAPIGALFLSDLVLGFYQGMSFVYMSVGLTVLVGSVIAARWSTLSVGCAAVVSSVMFFTVTNFGVWLLGGLYPATLSGLVACYVAAVPFFERTIAGDLFYCGILFGGFALLERTLPSLRHRAAAQTV